MAKYKQTDAEYGQGQFLEVNLGKQLIAGIYEYMVNDLITQGAWHRVDKNVQFKPIKHGGGGQGKAQCGAFAGG
jgi:hypothetical protein